MAIFRKLHTAFWQDAKVIEELTPEDKFFFIYLLTNPATTQIGIYQITKKQMSFELGYSIESINSLMDRFENHHKLIKYNPYTREIALKNWGKYNLDRSGKPMLDCVKKELEEVSDISLIEYVSKGIKKEDIKDIFKSYLNKENINKSNNDTYNESYTDTFKNLGQEEEKDKEEYKEKDIDKEKDLKSSNVSKYAKLYEQNIGLINGITAEYLIELSETIDVNLFKRAIEIATDKGKCNLGYIKGIIKQWLDANIRTLEQLEAYKLQQEQSKQKGVKSDVRRREGITKAESTTDNRESEEARRAELLRQIRELDN